MARRTFSRDYEMKTGPITWTKYREGHAANLTAEQEAEAEEAGALVPVKSKKADDESKAD